MLVRSTKSGEHLDILDGLRGLAILLVVVFHVWQQSWWNWFGWSEPSFLLRRGYMGVELFFFLSGFCLYWPLGQSTTPPPWRTYFLRRGFKILPSYWLALGVALFLAPWSFSPARLGFQLVAHLTFLHSLFFESYYEVSGVLWSLSVEVQFYLLFPLVALLFRKSPLVGWAFLATLAALYRLWVFRTFHTTDEGVGYTIRMNQLPAFLDLFGTGMLAAVVVARLREQPRRWWCGFVFVLALVGLYLVLRTFEGRDQGRNAEINHQALIRLPFALILLITTVSGALAPRGVRWLLANPPLTFLATLSYNLYLWHAFLCLRLKAWHVVPSAFKEPWQDDPAWGIRFTWLTYAVALVVASVLTFGLERPLLRWGRRFTAPEVSPSEGPERSPEGGSGATEPIAFPGLAGSLGESEEGR